MSVTALLFALPIVLAGGWYLTGANTGAKLEDHEGARASAARSRLRRINGMIMITAGVLLYVVISRAIALRIGDAASPGLALPIATIALVPLVLAMLGLAYLDMRLTRRLKKRLMGTVAREAAQRWQAEQASRGLVVLLALSLVVAGCEEKKSPDAPKSAVEQRMEKQRAADAQRRSESDQARQTARAAAEQGEPQNLPTMTLPVGDVTLKLMVADNDDERATGLMHRTEMGLDEGMIFAFPDARERRFWMENTPLPLDLIFLDAKGAVLAIGQGTPGDRSWIRSRGPAQWVIELNQGRAAEIGIRVGNKFSTSRLPRTIE